MSLHLLLGIAAVCVPPQHCLRDCAGPRRSLVGGDPRVLGQGFREQCGELRRLALPLRRSIGSFVSASSA
eukprot:SAG31_NODE_3814_length_3859_cov_5.598936_7_plen_70_part_00